MAHEQKDPRTVNSDQMTDVLVAMPDGGEAPLLVTGNSMTPFLLDRRSVVFLRKEEGYVPKKGDIVFFRRESGSLVLHRVCKVKADGTLVINGDAQTWTEIICPEQVLAHVTHFVRRKRDVSVTEWGYRALVAIWMPLRPCHAIFARLVIYWHLIPAKLSRRKSK